MNIAKIETVVSINKVGDVDPRHKQSRIAMSIRPLNTFVIDPKGPPVQLTRDSRTSVRGDLASASPSA